MRLCIRADFATGTRSIEQLCPSSPIMPCTRTLGLGIALWGAVCRADTRSLKVFPPNQRTQGIFNEQDLRLKSLMKDMDCSDLAVREAWESFVSVS